jgi:hypothetical protein
MGHHGEVGPGEGAALHEQDLAATALFGRRPDDADRKAHVVGYPGQRPGRADRRGGDDVVAAGVSDPRQGVVLGADRHVERAAAGASGEGGGQIAGPRLDLEAGVGQRGFEPA